MTDVTQPVTAPYGESRRRARAARGFLPRARPAARTRPATAGVFQQFRGLGVDGALLPHLSVAAIRAGAAAAPDVWWPPGPAR
ncbi:hypothetical protein NCC78_18455 [Micromonospora phytophila]|uniref:hypothetical protein n=1 Tax=Micromonospora phytophila TaxID=709888 RepID=UPI002030BCEA|nr:hypothetical protein [Micromonospora phytophila]MCM0676652.1 hypothetical protein [Micromonospora phytophila]